MASRIRVCSPPPQLVNMGGPWVGSINRTGTALQNSGPTKRSTHGSKGQPQSLSILLRLRANGISRVISHCVPPRLLRLPTLLLRGLVEREADRDRDPRRHTSCTLRCGCCQITQHPGLDLGTKGSSCASIPAPLKELGCVCFLHESVKIEFLG